MVGKAECCAFERSRSNDALVLRFRTEQPRRPLQIDRIAPGQNTIAAGIRDVPVPRHAAADIVQIDEEKSGIKHQLMNLGKQRDALEYVVKICLTPNAKDRIPQLSIGAQQNVKVVPFGVDLGKI